MADARLLALARQHQATGDHARAEQLCRQVVADDPHQADAWRLLAEACLLQGRFAEAAEAYQAALRLGPQPEAVHSNLGAAHSAQGELERAAVSDREAVRLKPGDARAWYNLGMALSALGQTDEVMASYQEALRIDPGHAAARNAQEVVLRRQGKLEEAAGGRRAPEQGSESAEVLADLGDALQRREELEEAVARYRRALELRPDFAEAHSNLGNALKAMGRPEEAAASCRQALELKPDLAGAHRNLGRALAELGELEEAMACYRRALELKPDYAAAYNNLGITLAAQGQIEEAIPYYRHALRLKPDDPTAYSNLLYSLQFCPGYDARAIYAEHLHWNRRYAEPLAKPSRPHPNDRSPDRRLRVGYVSPHFYSHVLCFFTIPLLSSHDRQQLEVFCYADVARPDAITALLRGYADAWRDIGGLSDEQLARLVRQDRIDILVDMAQHMDHNRLPAFARKPAPVQVAWLGYPGTTGLSAIDYRLTDPYLDPPGLFDDCYSEESLRLPDAFWCYDPLFDRPQVNPLPALGAGAMTFGCLNHFRKVNAGCLALWARVLRAVPGSRLLLMAPRGPARDGVLARLDREGIAAARVTFADRRPRLEYLELYHQIDLCLDTLPYNGHATSLDALWMGVPTLTMPGQTVVGRAGLSLLRNLGLPELIAEGPEDFSRLAAELAADLPRLGQLRATLRDRLQGSPLMDATRFARNVEAAYRLMWQRWCAG